MISITSIVPGPNASNVYRDVSIDITFSAEVHDTSLNSNNFKLYLSDWSGTVSATVSKVANVVKIVPESDLAENTQYAVWVRGDKNPADSDAQGVLSVIGEVMDDHYISYFTTGTDRQVDINLENEIGANIPVDPSSNNTFYNEAELIDEYQNNTILDILRTNPSDGAGRVDDISNITVTFDQPIQTHGAISNIVDISVIPLVFGSNPQPPEITSVSADNTSLIIATSGEMWGNAEYSVTLFNDGVTGLPSQSEPLPTDYTWSFTSPMWPLYASPYLVRKRGGRLIPAGMTDSDIERYILDASIWLQQATGHSYDSGVVPPYDWVSAVVCKTILDIAEAIGAGTLLGIKEKELADLRIVYNTDGIKDKLDDLEDCINNSLMGLGYDRRTNIGVKSFNATLRKYPGGKRRIHRYNRTDILNRRY